VPRIDRYLMTQLTVLFGFFSLVLVSVYWLNRAVRLFDQLISDGQSAMVFLQFTALALPNVIRLVLPIACFATTIYVTNRMMVESELVVVQATGFSNFRLARPVAMFGLMVAALVMALNTYLVPVSRSELARQRGVIAQNVTTKLLVEGQFLHPAKGITFFIREINGKGELLDIFLSDARNPRQRTTYTANRARLVAGDSGPKLVMFEGMAQTLKYGAGQRLSVTHFADSVFDVASLIKPAGPRVHGINELATSALLAADPDQIARLGSTRAAFLYEAHARIAQPFLAVAGALIGFAALMLGGFSRFGVWPQILLAVALLIGLVLLQNAVAQFARRQAALWPTVYLPPLAGCVSALALLWLSEHPALLRWPVWRSRNRGGAAA